MDILNEKVEHIMFGSGVITEMNKNKISIQFQEKIGTKMFIYPDAFEKFLKVSNPALENNIMEELRNKKEQLELEIKRIEKEHEAAEIEARKHKLTVVRKKSTTTTKKKSKN